MGLFAKGGSQVIWIGIYEGASQTNPLLTFVRDGEDRGIDLYLRGGVVLRKGDRLLGGHYAIQQGLESPNVSLVCAAGG